MVHVERKQFAEIAADVADTLVADFDLIEFVQGVARHATDLTGGAAAAVMLHHYDASLHQIGASSADARIAELFQLQNSEGPCLDCYRTGEPVVVADLSRVGDRWPSFAPRAVAAGMVSAYAFPLRLRDRVIGALTVFQTRPQELRVEDVRALQALADLATIALIQEAAVSRAEVVTEQLGSALQGHTMVERAKEAIARSFDVTTGEAFILLRDHARSSRRRLTDVAREVVTSPSGPRTLHPG